MFIGVFKNTDNKIENYIYYSWKEWHKNTFNPTVEIIGLLNFKISGKKYIEKQENLKNLAIEWQLNFSNYNWSYGELAEIYGFFEKNGRKYGLLKEFKENCII